MRVRYVLMICNDALKPWTQLVESFAMPSSRRIVTHCVPTMLFCFVVLVLSNAANAQVTSITADKTFTTETNYYGFGGNNLTATIPSGATLTAQATGRHFTDFFF